MDPESFVRGGPGLTLNADLVAFLFLFFSADPTRPALLRNPIAL